MHLCLSEICEILGVPLRLEDKIVAAYSIDSRAIKPGSLFFALRGEKQDGHAFVQDAINRGALAAIVDRPTEGPVIQVEDSLRALQILAHTARTRFKGEVVAVTGSAGKTTTKETIAKLLETEMPVGKSIANLNNDIGLPLSILSLPMDARAWVIELGMNHENEIRNLSKIALPTIGVVTNVGYAHIQYFGSVEGIALAKRELIESLPSDGVAVLNADDPHVLPFAAIHPGRTITFGLSDNADVRAQNVGLEEQAAVFECDGVQFRSRLTGRHGVLNVLASIAVARYFGLATMALQDPVSQLVPGVMRGERLSVRGATVLNDCYNSNPDALRCMIDLLCGLTARRRIAVLGEMLELGEWSERLHRGVGEYLARSGVDLLLAIQGAARHMADEAISSGMERANVLYFEEPLGAGAALAQIAAPGDAILFKGSRGTHVERALKKFLDAGG